MFWEWGGSVSQVHTVAWLLTDKVSIVITHSSSLLSWLVCQCCQIEQNKAADDSIDFFIWLSINVHAAVGIRKKLGKMLCMTWLLSNSLAIAGLATISCNSDSAYDANKLDYVLHSQWWHLLPRVCWPQCPARIWVWPWGSGEPQNALFMSFIYFSILTDFFVALDMIGLLPYICLCNEFSELERLLPVRSFPVHILLEMQSIAIVMVDGWIKFTLHVSAHLYLDAFRGILKDLKTMIQQWGSFDPCQGLFLVLKCGYTCARPEIASSSRPLHWLAWELWLRKVYSKTFAMDNAVMYLYVLWPWG